MGKNFQVKSMIHFADYSPLSGKNTELTVEDKYKRTLKEIESLKAELGIL